MFAFPFPYVFRTTRPSILLWTALDFKYWIGMGIVEASAGLAKNPFNFLISILILIVAITFALREGCLKRVFLEPPSDYPGRSHNQVNSGA